MGTFFIYALAIACIAALFLLGRYERKKANQAWDRIPEIRKEILTAKTKEELTAIADELTIMFKESNNGIGNGNSYLLCTINELILIIKTRIEIDFS